MFQAMLVGLRLPAAYAFKGQDGSQSQLDPVKRSVSTTASHLNHMRQDAKMMERVMLFHVG